MLHRTGLFACIFLALVVVSGTLMAQGSEVRPPTCCAPLDPPPPPPEGAATPLTATSTDVMPVLTVSDAELQASGITHAQFLTRLANAVFALDAGQDYVLILPILKPVTAADGSTSVQITYFSTASKGVAPEVLQTLSLVFVSDGQSTLAVLFTSDDVVK